MVLQVEAANTSSRLGRQIEEKPETNKAVVCVSDPRCVADQAVVVWWGVDNVCIPIFILFYLGSCGVTLRIVRAW